MKRIVFTLLLACIMILTAGTTVSAQGTVSLLENKDTIIRDGKCVEREDGSYCFSLISEEKIKDNIEQKTQINYVLIPTTEEAKTNLHNAITKLKSSGGSTTLNDSDTAGCVSAYCTINWNSYTLNKKTYLYLTGISGGYTAQGSGRLKNYADAIIFQSAI